NFNTSKLKNIGLIPNVAHEITLSNNKTIHAKPFRIPLKHKERVHALINDLLRDGIIQKSNSKYSSPTFLIVKKNGDIRLVIDYRELNKLTCVTHYIFPKIWDILVQLKGSLIFSKVDLKSGYYQIAVAKESIKYTAFLIENDKYEWLRMPFKLTNAPKTFQKVMDNLFSHLEFVKVYLDDIIVHSKTLEIHEKHFEEVLNIINNNNIKININKSEFFVDKIKFLGHEILSERISADKGHLEKFEIKTPKNKKGIQRILGFLIYFKIFIHNFSKKTLFMTDLLKKDSKTIWKNSHAERLEMLIDEIRRSPILICPDMDKDFQLETDASDRAIGAVLKQN
ncbi:Retrovirus-related Pol polyprotein from transposon, partial [Dictyocoela muelleri]